MKGQNSLWPTCVATSNWKRAGQNWRAHNRTNESSRQSEEKFTGRPSEDRQKGNPQNTGHPPWPQTAGNNTDVKGSQLRYCTRNRPKSDTLCGGEGTDLPSWMSFSWIPDCSRGCRHYRGKQQRYSTGNQQDNDGLGDRNSFGKERIERRVVIQSAISAATARRSALPRPQLLRQGIV